MISQPFSQPFSQESFGGEYSFFINQIAKRREDALLSLLGRWGSKGPRQAQQISQMEKLQSSACLEVYGTGDDTISKNIQLP